MYAFTNKYFEIKVHNYFYYFFDLSLSVKDYEKRVKELSTCYSILYTEFDSHMFRSYRNLARDRRVIILRNKYIPISFTLTYYAEGFESHYNTVYPNTYVAGTRPVYTKKMNASSHHSRTQILQKYYPERIKKQIREGRRRIAIPIGRILIIGRVISVLLVLALALFLGLNYNFTMESFIEQRNSFFSLFAFLLVVLLSTY